MRWKIEEGNEVYKIVSCLAPTMVLCTASSSSTPGQKLILSDYEDNTSYRDEWELTKIQYVATVSNYYDDGYHVFFSEAETASQQKINTYANAVALRYLELFGLVIEVE